MTERRAHVRRAGAVPVSVTGEGAAAAVDASTVDVSLGGMRLRATQAISGGRCVVTLEEGASLIGNVVDQEIDLRTGEMIVRLSFIEAPPAARECLTEILRETTPPGAPRRRVALMAAGALAAALAVIVGLGVKRSVDSAPRPSFVESAASVEASRTGVAESSPSVSTDSSTTEAVVPPVVPAPMTTTVRAPAVAPAAAPPTSAVPAPATTGPTMRTENSDHQVQVHLAPQGEHSSASSAVGPSDGVDPVRVQLQVDPEPRGTEMSVWVSVENRSGDTLEMPDGFSAMITASKDGTVVRRVALRRADVVEIAPGETAVIEGAIDLQEPGDYELSASTVVGTSEG